MTCRANAISSAGPGVSAGMRSSAHAFAFGQVLRALLALASGGGHDDFVLAHGPTHAERRLTRHPCCRVSRTNSQDAVGLHPERDLDLHLATPAGRQPGKLQLAERDVLIEAPR